MQTKHTWWAVVGILCLACAFSGCQSSKIAYGNSYYFKQTPKPQKETPPVHTTAPEKKYEVTATASREETSKNSEAIRVEEARQELATTLKENKSPALKASVERTRQLARDMKSETLTKQEKRATRKELRKEMRTLVKEFRHAAPEATQEIDRYLKLAIILWGVAIILSILSGVSGSLGILWVLATIAGIAGTVFFILWLVDELD